MNMPTMGYQPQQQQSSFMQSNPYASMQQYGPTVSGGSTDYLAQLTPTLSSVDYSGIDMGNGSGAGGNWWDSMVGTKEAPGWGGMALGGASALMNGFMAMKQYGLAKDTLAANKEQFRLNYDAQKKTTNSSLEDRQRARVASNPGAYQSVGSYMAQHGIGG